jgi:hypothetical protein
VGEVNWIHFAQDSRDQSRAILNTGMKYNLKVSRRLNSIKSSRAHSRVKWFHVESDVSGTISVPIIKVVMWL